MPPLRRLLVLTRLSRGLHIVLHLPLRGLHIALYFAADAEH